MSTPWPAGGSRQTTLGEAVAAVRASAHPGAFGFPAVSVEDAMEMLWALPICSVCGWTRRAHEGAQRSLTCGTYHP
jgi:hypothetical protein